MIKIYVLANTILNRQAISGGDTIFPQMYKYVNKNYEIHVIGNTLTKEVWDRFGAKAIFHLYSDTLMERFERIVFGPIKYLMRTVQATLVVWKELSSQKKRVLLYTSSDIFPDVIPAFLGKVFFHHARWIGRVYYVNASPLKRKGNFFHSLFSFLAQRSGFLLMKKSCDITLVLPASYKEVLQQGFSTEKIETISTGIDLPTIVSVQSSLKQYDAVYVGSMLVSRGAFELLQIWRKVIANKRHAQLAIVGGGERENVEEMKRQIVELGLKSAIRFIGFLPSQRDVFSVIKSSKLFLSPRLEGGWDMPTLEASALGVPAIAYDMDTSSIPLERGITVIPLYNQDAFAKTIVALLSQPEKRRALATLTRREVKKYSWQTITAQLEDKIKHLL